MKRIIAVFLVLFVISSASMSVCAQNVPDSYMELSVTGDWHIFSKDMENKELLDAVGMSSGQINEILKDSGSESVIINSKTGEQVFVKVMKNDLSYELWNIQNADDAYLLENISKIIEEGFNVSGFDFAQENVSIENCAYMKQITIHGSTFYKGSGHGIVISGTFVNGYAIVFMSETAETAPDVEEILKVKELLSGVSFTVIKDKTDEKFNDSGKEGDVFGFILGGFGALVVIIFCAYMIERLRHKEETPEDAEEIKEE